MEKASITCSKYAVRVSKLVDLNSILSLKAFERIIVYFFLLSLMIPISTPIGPEWSRVYFWDFSLIMLFCCWAVRSSFMPVSLPKIYIMDVLLFALILWLLICNLNGMRPEKSHARWLLWARGLFMYLYFSRNFEKVFKANDILAILSLIVFIESALCIIQFATQSNFGQINQYFGPFKPEKIPGFWYQGHKYIRAPGTFFNTGLVASWMAILLPVILSFYFFSDSRNLKKVALAVWYIGIFGVLCTLSRIAIISIILGSILTLYWRRIFKLSTRINKKHLAFVLILFLVTASIGSVSYSTGIFQIGVSRVSTYKKSLEKKKAYMNSAYQIMSKRPTFGVGQGNFGLLLDETDFDFFHHGEGVVHNTPLLLGTESGYIGFFIFNSVLFYLILKFISRIQKTPSNNFQAIKGGVLIGLVCYIFNMQWSPNLIHHSMLPLFFVALGLSSANQRNYIL